MWITSCSSFRWKKWCEHHRIAFAAYLTDWQQICCQIQDFWDIFKTDLQRSLARRYLWPWPSNSLCSSYQLDLKSPVCHVGSLLVLPMASCHVEVPFSLVHATHYQYCTHSTSFVTLLGCFFRAICCIMPYVLTITARLVPSCFRSNRSDSLVPRRSRMLLHLSRSVVHASPSRLEGFSLSLCPPSKLAQTLTSPLPSERSI